MTERFTSRRLIASAMSIALALLVLASCARDREAGRTLSNQTRPCEEADASPVDQVLMAWLSKARTLHHLADVAEDEGNLEQAIGSLEQLAGGTMPSARHPEVAEVMADTFARLGELRARRGAYQRAEQDIASGLRYAPGPTYFRGHLLEVRGLVYDKEGRELEKAGKLADAKRAREKAVEASLEAVRIQNEVITSTLGDAGAKGTRD